MTRRYTIQDPVARFWSCVEKTDQCWLWMGTILRNGYGQFTVRCRPFKAHRYSYELLKGKIPPGLTLDHLCRNRACINPDHLEIVTLKENLARGIGPTAMNSRKTHCKKGHVLAGGNLMMDGSSRMCRACRNDYFREYAKTLHRKEKMRVYRKKYELADAIAQEEK